MACLDCICETDGEDLCEAHKRKFGDYICGFRFKCDSCGVRFKFKDRPQANAYEKAARDAYDFVYAVASRYNHLDYGGKTTTPAAHIVASRLTGMYGGVHTGDTYCYTCLRSRAGRAVTMTDLVLLERAVNYLGRSIRHVKKDRNNRAT